MDRQRVAFVFDFPDVPFGEERVKQPNTPRPHRSKNAPICVHFVTFTCRPCAIDALRTTSGCGSRALTANRGGAARGSSNIRARCRGSERGRSDMSAFRTASTVSRSFRRPLGGAPFHAFQAGAQRVGLAVRPDHSTRARARPSLVLERSVRPIKRARDATNSPGASRASSDESADTLALDSSRWLERAAASGKCSRSWRTSCSSKAWLVAITGAD